jgi:large subunit ribosomal protein L1
MGTKRNADMSATNDEIKIVTAPGAETADTQADADKLTDSSKTGDSPDTEAADATAAKPKKAKPKGPARSARYSAARAQVDKTKTYDPFAAIEMLKKLSYSKFDGTITAHLLLIETGTTANLTLPHSTGKTIKVAIASDKVIADIAAGNIDFDVLVSSKEFMPKLTKHARTLGPRGLMPNPKRGTLTSNPEGKKKELEAGKMMIKTEKKAPVMHITIGKVSMDTKMLVENLQELLNSLTDKVLKASIAASMSPGVKVTV